METKSPWCRGQDSKKDKGEEEDFLSEIQQDVGLDNMKISEGPRVLNRSGKNNIFK